jgi:hypothetical protein
VPFALGAALLVVVVAVAAQGLLASVLPDWAPAHAMQAMPEWNLRAYPGATQTGEAANPREPFWDLSDDQRLASVYHTYNVRADWDAVGAWYDAQLKPLGWRRPCPYGVCLDEWHRTGYYYKIWVFSSAPVAGGEADIGFSAGLSEGTYDEDWAPARALQALPAANLQPYPGAVLLADEAWPRTSGTEAENASLVRRFGLNGATWQQVLGWYDTQLRTLGWVPACGDCGAQPLSTGQWMRRNPAGQIPTGYEIDVTPLSGPSLGPADQRLDLVFSELLVEAGGS